MTAAHRASGEPTDPLYPVGDDEQALGVAIFTRRGDGTATGWLDAYQRGKGTAWRRLLEV